MGFQKAFKINNIGNIRQSVLFSPFKRPQFTVGQAITSTDGAVSLSEYRKCWPLLMERPVEKGRKNEALYDMSHAALEAFSCYS